MAGTQPIPWGDDRSKVIFSADTAYEVVTSSFFGRNFLSNDGSAPVHRLIELEKSAGDQIRIDKFNQLTGTPVVGDARARGKEKSIRGTSMPMWINQARVPVGCGGKMSRKRSEHDLRMVARKLSTVYWSRWFDEEGFIYLAGRRGTATKNWLHPVTGYDVGDFAGNQLVLPPSTHVFYPEGITAQTSLVNTHIMSPKMIEWYDYLISTMENPPEPVIINGEEFYFLIMSKYQSYLLNKGSSSTDLGDFQQLKKYGKSEKDMPWSGILGKWKRFLLFDHNKVIRTYDATYNSGAGGVVDDCLILGAQALALAHGDAGQGFHFWWHEEPIDYGNEPVVVTGTMYGMEKVQFRTDPDDANSVAPHGVVVARLFGGTSASI